MDDLILRQEAINEIKNITSSMSVCVNSDECRGMKRMQENACKVIKELPPVNTEITYCKDCKHKHLEQDVWICPFGMPGGPYFFCGYGAEGTERTEGTESELRCMETY